MAATEFEDVKGFLPMEEAEKLRQWATLGAQVGRSWKSVVIVVCPRCTWQTSRVKPTLLFLL